MQNNLWYFLQEYTVNTLKYNWIDHVINTYNYVLFFIKCVTITVYSRWYGYILGYSPFKMHANQLMRLNDIVIASWTFYILILDCNMNRLFLSTSIELFKISVVINTTYYKWDFAFICVSQLLISWLALLFWYFLFGIHTPFCKWACACPQNLFSLSITKICSRPLANSILWLTVHICHHSR